MERLAKALAITVAVVPLARADVTSPIACNLSVFTKAERARHLELIAMLKANVAEMRESADGYSFRYAADLVRPLAEWTTLETKCCPFIDFQIELEPQPGGSAWLRLRGEPRVKEFISAEFEPLLVSARTKVAPQ
ncbi:MAG TPA: hypothetical protein VG454_15905 [Gemmatimonadales bacterium]|nr:hypothetical protein [Gemmatimonadales bacterium]